MNAASSYMAEGQNMAGNVYSKAKNFFGASSGAVAEPSPVHK
jgi:hypothetical protein